MHFHLEFRVNFYPHSLYTVNRLHVLFFSVFFFCNEWQTWINLEEYLEKGGEGEDEREERERRRGRGRRRWRWRKAGWEGRWKTGVREEGHRRGQNVRRERGRTHGKRDRGGEMRSRGRWKGGREGRQLCDTKGHSLNLTWIKHKSRQSKPME